MLGSVGWSEFLGVWIVVAVLTYIVAGAKGRQPAWWTILALLFGFIPLLLLLVLPSNKPHRVTIVHDPEDASDADELERLADLHDRGALSDDEFAAAKARVLGQQR